ncbi:dual specificity protein kinase TTK-like [Tubulanus polymorphus]|uniref:dual specificity protein kinase TTK-like n=1 Tax=Tubulanus polymorphus TaxID=672921 RepID=UPI003DA44EFE
MTSLKKLNQRLQELRDKKSLSVAAGVESESVLPDDTTDQAFPLIQSLYNHRDDPSVWLQYISSYEKQNGGDKYEKLCRLYSRALEVITNSNQKKKEDYAKLMVNFAKLKSTDNEVFSEELFHRVITECKQHPFVHIEAAQFYCDKGNPTKSLRILEDAQKFHMDDTIVTAMNNLRLGRKLIENKHNAKPGLNPIEESSVAESSGKRCRHVSDLSARQHQTQQQQQQKQQTSSCHNYTLPSLKKQELKSITQSLKDSSISCKQEQKQQQQQQQKHTDLSNPVALRSYHSTPDCKTVGPLSTVKKSTSKRVMLNFKPMRVPVSQLGQLKEINSKFHDDDDEDDDDGLSGIIPMRKGSVTSDTGYLSQSTTTQPTQPRKYSLMEVENGSPEDAVAAASKNIEMKRKYSLMDIDISPESSRPPPSNSNHASSDKENHPPATTEKTSQDSKGVRNAGAPGSDNVFTEPSTGQSRTLKPVLSIPQTAATHLPQVTPMKYIIENNLSSHSSIPYHQVAARATVENTPAAHGSLTRGTPAAHLLPFKCTPLTKPKTNQIMVVNDKSYEVLNMIGRGGTSKVYQVFSAEYKKTLAIKKVDLEGCDEATIQGYLNEVNILYQLQDCDSVVKMYDCEYNTDDSILSVVMERGDTDLSRLFYNRQKKPFSENAIMFYWQCMLEAVQSLHQRGIVHSDLKPANFLLVAGHLKLIDFGIANAIQPDKTSVTRQQQIGTPNYMSPEAIYSRGHHTDSTGKHTPKYKLGVASDVWSLGCILYNMVYGYTPFQSYNDVTSKLQAIVNPEIPIPFPEINDRNVMDVLKKCLQRDPKKRPCVSDLLRHPYLGGSKPADSVSSQEELLMKLGKVALNQLLANSSPGHMSRALTELMTKQGPK